MVNKDLNISLATKMLKILTFIYISPKNDRIWKNFDETKFMSFLIKDDESLEKYNDILEKV